MNQNKIWNPNALGCWALLVTPLCSSYLLYKNAEKFNDVDSMKACRDWSIAYLVLLIFSIFILILNPEYQNGVNGIGLWYLIIWYFQLVKKEVKKTKQRLGENYERPSTLEWFLFVVIGLVIRAILMGLTAVIVAAFIN